MQKQKTLNIFSLIFMILFTKFRLTAVFQSSVVLPYLTCFSVFPHITYVTPVHTTYNIHVHDFCGHFHWLLNVIYCIKGKHTNGVNPRQKMPQKSFNKPFEFLLYKTNRLHFSVCVYCISTQNTLYSV